MKLKILIIALCLISLVITDGQSTVTSQVVDTPAVNQQSSNTQSPQQPQQPQPAEQKPTNQGQLPPPDVVAEVGQIFPGQIDITQSKQAMHYIKTGQL